MTRTQLRRLACVAIVGLLAACGGAGTSGSGTTAAGPTTGAAVTTTTTEGAATTVAGSTTVTPATTVTTGTPATTGDTTLAPTTTTVAPLTVDASVLSAAGAATGYALAVTSDAAATAPFTWIGRVPTRPTYERYAVATVTRDGAPVATLAAFGLRSGAFATEAGAESAFHSAVQTWISSTGAVSHVLIGIEWATTAASPVRWYAWLHEGTGYLLWGDDATAAKAAAVAMSVAMHVHAPYDVVASAEGEGVLDARFVDLSDGCGYGDVDPYFSADELIALSDGWRSHFPYALHSALRTVQCGGAVIASLSIIQMHPEFAAHVAIDQYLQSGLPSATDTLMKIDGVPVAFGSDGAIRFLDDGYLYQLASVTRGGKQVATTDQLTNIALTLITTPVPS